MRWIYSMCTPSTYIHAATYKCSKFPEINFKGICKPNAHTGLPPNMGIKGKSGNFIFNLGKAGGKKIFWKIREVIELLLFHFREVTFSILSHTSS